MVYQYYKLHSRLNWCSCARQLMTGMRIWWFVSVWLTGLKMSYGTFISFKLVFNFIYINEQVRVLTKELFYSHTYLKSAVRSATIIRMSKYQMSTDRRFWRYFNAFDTFKCVRHWQNSTHWNKLKNTNISQALQSHFACATISVQNIFRY